MNFPSRITDEQQKILQEFLAETPVRVGALARALGLQVKSATLRPGISGQIQRARTPSGFEIKVNRHEAPNRQRFTIAHEIAHYLLHKDRIKDGIEDSILYRSPAMTNALEVEANRLAADILMPKPAIIYHINRLGGVVNSNTAAILAEKFKTSEDAMKVRLGLY